MRLRCPAIALIAALAVAAEPAQPPVRLFILSGQSNMANLRPEVTFEGAVQQAFPGEEIVVVKEAINGQQIRMWLKDWKPPEGRAEANGKPARMDGNGRIYRSLLDKVGKAVDGKPAPASVVFCWLQGEADARAGYGAVYEAGLRQLLANLKADLKREDLDIVIARISDYGNERKDEEPDWNLVRDIQVKVAESTPRATWIDCDDLNGPKDGLHYPATGYRELGDRFAAAAVALIKGDGKAPRPASVK